MFYPAQPSTFRRLLALAFSIVLAASFYSHSSAQTATPAATASADVPTFKQVLQIGKGAIQSIYNLDKGKTIAVNVASQIIFYDDHLKLLGTLDTGSKVITTSATSDKYFALGYEDGSIQLFNIADRTMYATLTGHTARINSIAFAKDGSELITGSNDNTARIWSISGRGLVATLSNLSSPVTNTFFTSDKNDHPIRAYTYTSVDHTIRLWDLKTNSVDMAIPLPESTIAVTASSTNVQYVVSNVENSTNNQLDLTDTVNHIQTVITTGFRNPPTNAAFSSDGTRLLIASSFSGEGKLLDTKTQQVVRTFNLPMDKLDAAVFSKDGSQLAFGLTTGGIVLENLKTGGEQRFQPFTTAVNRLYFNYAQNRLIMTSAGGQIAIYETNGKPDGTFDIGSDVNFFDYDPESLTLVTTNSTGELTTWNTVSLTKTATLTGFSNPVSPVRWSPDGKQIAGVTPDHVIHVWDAVTGNDLLQLKGHTVSVNSIAWSLDGKLIASASSDMTARIWDTITGKELQRISFTDRVYAIAFSPDSHILGIGSRQTGRLLSFYTVDGQLLSSAGKLNQTVTNIVWRPNDLNHLAIGESGGATASVDLTSPTNPQIAETAATKFGISGLTWSPHGTYVVTSGYDQFMRVWSYADNLTIQNTVALVSASDDVSWSPSGNLLALTQGDLIIITNPYGALLTTIAGHKGDVYDVQWSADGTKLVSDSADGTIRIWQKQ